jgi:hypothetical protein
MRQSFREVLARQYRTILQACGALRERRLLGRDDHGLYLLRAT